MAAIACWDATTPSKQAGIQPITGVVLDVEWRGVGSSVVSSAARPLPLCASFAQRDLSASCSPLATRHSIVLLAMDMEGYSNLCQLVTLRHLGTTKLSQNMNLADTDGRPVTLQELAEHSRSIIALCPLPARSREAF